MEKGYFEEDIKYLKKKNSWQDKMGIKISKLGIIPVPFAFFRFKKILGLNYSQILFIGIILMYKQNGLSYFSLAKLNRDFGFSTDTSNRIVKSLRAKGYLVTTPRKENPKGKGRNQYDISTLINIIEQLIDGYKEELFKTKAWTNNDSLDYAFIKDYEKEASENSINNGIKNIEHNK